MFGRKKDTFKSKIEVDYRKRQVTATGFGTRNMPGGGKVTWKTVKKMNFDEVEQKAQEELEAREAQQNRPALGHED